MQRVGSGRRIERVVILGGGTAGWMTAAALSRVFKSTQCRIELVESQDIGTIGVGEATIPTILWFNQLVGLDEAELIQETKATYKPGIEFQGWTRPDNVYFHPFGRYGHANDGVAFHHRWIRARLDGLGDGFEEYSLNAVLARANRFARPAVGSILETLGYAYHFDASLYAGLLRKGAEQRGVRRHDGRVVRVEQCPETGFIRALHTDRGEALAGDLFIDCSGLQGHLIEGTLKSGFDDWSHWLPCDRAWAVPSERLRLLVPYTRSASLSAGWQWRIPLQHRTGNGYVFCSNFISDDEASSVLLAHLDERPLSDPRLIRFVAGRRRRPWMKNVIAIGLAGGFLEPLESTSIHLIQSAIAKLLALFPNRDCDPYLVEQFNRLLSREYETIRDFLVLHYHSTSDNHEPLWEYCRSMKLPEELVYREEHFRRTGRIVISSEDLFREASWFSVLAGQGIQPTDYNPLADCADSEENLAYLRDLKGAVAAASDKCGAHESYIQSAGAKARASGRC